MRKKIKYLLFVVALSMVLGFSFNPFEVFGKENTDTKKQEEIQQKKADIRKMVDKTLDRLYKLMPESRKAIEKSAGYAVFSNFGMKIFVVGGGSGKGILFDKSSNREVFMKMIEAQAGLGLGVKRFSVIFVFEKQSHVDSFANSGWEFGGQTTLSAKIDDAGGALSGAVSVSPGVWMYQMTEDGLAAELTGKGTKYYQDDKLNQ